YKLYNLWCCHAFYLLPAEDSNWYRASVVKHIADDSVLVGYLDFGNAEALNISRLRHIDADMLSIPFQAAQCCLAGVKPPSGTWTSEASQALGVLTMNKIITAAVVSESSGILTMDLIDESITPNIFVSKHLIEAGLAVPDTSGSKSPSKTQASLPGDSSVQLKWAELPLGQVTEVVVCMLRNPGEFFCHICNQTDLNLLDELNTALGKYCKDHTSEDYRPVREEVCAAFYTGDGNWYRGQVKDFAPDGVTKFLFLDYGNLENVPVEKLCKIPPSFLELPFQAMCCSLAGVKPPGDQWDKQAAETFQKSVVGIKLKAKAVGHTKHGYSVELVACETANVITDVLLAEGAAVRDDGKVGKTAMGTGLSPVQERANMVNDSLKSHRDLLITRDIKMPPLTQRESHSTPCTSPADSTKSSLSFQRELLSTNCRPSAPTELRPPDAISLSPKDFNSGNATPSVYRELNSTNSTPSAQSALRSPISTLSMTESLFASPPMPRENPACSPTTLRPKDLRSANSTPPARNELRSPNYSPSLPKEPFSTKCSPPVSRQLGSTSSTPPAQSALRPPISTLSTTESLFASPPMPRENPACSPTTLRPRDLRSANSTPPARNELRSPNYSPSLPKEPFSTKCSPPVSRQLGSTSSTPPAQSALRPPISTLSTTESLFASPPMPRENPACSPTTLRPRDLRSANSTPPARNELRSPNYSPSLPKEPFSTKCSPPASRQLGSTNSTPSAERDLYSSANKQRPPVLQETLSCNNSANRRSPVIQDTSGKILLLMLQCKKLIAYLYHVIKSPTGRVCIARRWESVDLPLNEALPACVLNVISPDLFYVFPKENRVNVGRLQQVMMDIFTHCSAETEQHSYKPLVGDACCAKFT
ncbi:uncharacterized protein LOC142136034, partial [Mixophyes fleayi]|uniref:uncharacterized protein LOC142136034 n=1 Tax=Mixophyes fleayi TaxID=3061075 RepID=UPI003F4DA115